MKTLLLLCALISTNAFASQKAAELYQILKDAGIPETWYPELQAYEEKIVGAYCREEGGEYSCGLDHDDKDGNMIQVEGANGKKMFELLAPQKLECKAGICEFFIDVVRCEYNLKTATSFSERAYCEVTRTEIL